MKIHKLLLVSSLSIFLIACSSDEPIEETQANEPDVEVVKEAEEIEIVEEIEDTEEVVEEETMEIDENQPLENIGEYKYTRDGRVELLYIVRPTESYRLIDGVDLNFIDIKIIYNSEIPESEKEFMRNAFGFDDEGYTLQIAYTATNNTNETVGGIEVEDVVTSNGNQYNLYTDGGPVTGSSYEVRPQATTNVGVKLSINNPDIDSLDLYFQPLDKEGYHLDESSINLSF